MSFAGEAEYFAGYLTPRVVNGAGDYLEFNLIPALSGLYAREMIKHTNIRYKKTAFNAVIASHPHMDHIGYLSFIDENIPIYCGECTKTIMEAIQESGRINLGEHKFHTFRTGKKPFEVGSLKIEPIHVDHSIPGAYGFIVRTSAGTIVYTGDFRLHGPMSKMTKEFINKAEEYDPKLIVSEGTRVCPEERLTLFSESMVKKKSSEVVSKTSKIVIVAFYSRDIDRFKTFYEIAKNNDRKFVIPMKLAYLLNKLKDDPRLKVPDVMKDDIILFYKKRKKTGMFKESDYYTWERPFLEKAVSYEYVHNNQSRVLFNLDLTGFTELIDIRPATGGHFIHSMSEPFSEEDVNFEVMHRWLDHFGLKFHQIHASGHCPSKDLVKVINRIKPRKLIPIHTEYPQLFKKLFRNIDVKTVQKGQSIKV